MNFPPPPKFFNIETSSVKKQTKKLFTKTALKHRRTLLRWNCFLSVWSLMFYLFSTFFLCISYSRGWGAHKNMKKPALKISHNRPPNCFFFSIANLPKISPNFIFCSKKMASYVTSTLYCMLSLRCSYLISLGIYFDSSRKRSEKSMWNEKNAKVRRNFVTQLWPHPMDG